MKNKKFYEKLPDREASFSKKFVKELLQWNGENNTRQMPWKGEKDPYKIWLSEIMLQQTRVEQGMKYYQRFIAAFPTVEHLANAPEMEVFKLWEGLGYYSRCRNLIETAKYISTDLNGIFPTDFPSILKLKGVGAYTAAAIASFAYNHPYAVVDGNVYRVLSRIFNIDTPIDTTEGKTLYAGLAQNILPEETPAVYNQAIMDFGAVICKPYPECHHCFFNTQCRAFLAGKQLTLPVKAKQTPVKERWFHYFIIKYDRRYAIRQRIAKDIWQNLYEFLLVETGKKTAQKEVLAILQKNYGLEQEEYSIVDKPVHYKQRLSHQLIHFSFTELQLARQYLFDSSFIWVNAAGLKKYPFPRTLQKVLSERTS